MKRAYFISLFLCLITTLLLSQSNPVPLVNQTASVVHPISASQADPKAQAKILDSYGKLPLSFEANHGQTDARVRFLSRTSGYSLFLTADEAVLALSGSKTNTKAKKITGTDHTLPPSTAAPKAGGVLRMKLRNANPAAKVTGVDELAGTSNYFMGNDPAKWRTNAATYAKVKYDGIYSGIDLVYYGNQRQLEYDFIVAPGADPHRIAFDVRGAKRIRQDAHGELVFNVGVNEIRWHKKDGARQEIAARYSITDTNRVGFELAKYDASKPLYIDPLIYSTYLGGSSWDYGYGIAVDSAGDAYVTGFTQSTDFPTMNPLQPTNAGGDQYCPDCDAFVSKINSSGSALVYSTYLGGSGGDYGHSIAVDGEGSAYLTGNTSSTNFPTMNPLQPTLNGVSNAFVTKLNPTGSALVYSTYLGGSGSENGFGIAVDGVGNAYVTGNTTSTNFPTMNPLQPTLNGVGNAFVTKINPTGSALVYSTYLGGSGQDWGYGIAEDSAGNAYVTGQSSSSNFPTTPGAFQTVCAGGVFVSKLNPTGSALVYSTYLCGGDYGYGIAADSAGNAYVTGYTSSTSFPTMNPLQSTLNGAMDAFVTKLNPTGSALVYSTYLGGSKLNGATAIAVDGVGSAYVTGLTDSSNFPQESPLQKCGRREQIFVSKFNPSGSALVYSTCFGSPYGTYSTYGIAVDGADNAYIIGISGPGLPTVNPLQPTYGGGEFDVFVAKIFIAGLTTTTLSSSANPSAYGEAVTLTALVTSALGAPPDGETVTFMDAKRVLGTAALSGGSASLTTSTLWMGTNEINAVYGGDSNFDGSRSKEVRQMVGKAATTTTLASSLNPSNSGQSVTFTASVTPQFGGKVTGTVTFYDGTTVLKTVALSGGAAKFKTSTLTSGTHSITATYNGSTDFDGSSASLTQTVD